MEEKRRKEGWRGEIGRERKAEDRKERWGRDISKEKGKVRI